MDTVLLPIERARLEGALAPFGASTGLPGEAYTSPATFAWEMRHFFEDSWVCVGRSADLPQAGDRRAVKAGAESALLLRDADGTPRAFFNVCPHRGHEMVEAGEAPAGAGGECPAHASADAL